MEGMQIRFFQFLAGERKNEIVMFDKIAEEDGDIFIEFKDGSRCNQNFILPLNDTNYTYQLMAEISEPSNMWSFKEEWVGREEEMWSPPEASADGKSYLIQPFSEGKKKVTPIPPRRVNSNFGSINVHRETPKPVAPAPPPPPTQEQVLEAKKLSDPVWSMMEASKKFPTTVNLELVVMLPKKSLFDVANESFTEGGEKVIEYIIENLDISLLKDALKESLYQAYGSVKPKPDINQSELFTGYYEPQAIEAPIIGEAMAYREDIED